MSKSLFAGRSGNRLLDLLPASEFGVLEPQLRKVELKLRQILYEPRGPIDHYYLPTNAALSAVTVMRDGHAIEVATIGNEGISGLPSLPLEALSPHRVIAQVEGFAWRTDAKAFRDKVEQLPKLRELVAKHHLALLFQVSQSIACNGLHVMVERCCRWLLMTHDRTEGDELTLTHEFLAMMLGVRRSGVTEALQSLQQQGLIRYGRGKIQVLDRERLEELSCECYQDVRDEYDRLLVSSELRP
jgi:CRP-like cAMP-binding protein